MIDVEVVPSARLGRPRVDIVIASAAEGMFNNVTVLMDRAVQLVKVVEEADNYVRRHYLRTKAVLIERSVRGRRRPTSGCPHLRRAAWLIQPQHVRDRGRQRHMG